METQMPEKLDSNQALLILVNAVKIGQKSGCYSLEEAELISKAIRHFTISDSENIEQPTSSASKL